MAEEKSTATNYTIDIGTNIIEKVNGTPSIFNLDGKPAFNFKIGRDNQLVLDSELRDNTDKLIAKIVNNSIVYCDIAIAEKYGDAKTTGVRNKQTRETLLEVT